MGQDVKYTADAECTFGEPPSIRELTQALSASHDPSKTMEARANINPGKFKVKITWRYEFERIG